MSLIETGEKFGRFTVLKKGASDMAGWIIGNLGPKPLKDYSLDRIDNNGHYEPGNLRWSNKSDQRRNVRPNVTNASDLDLISEVERRRGYAFVPPKTRRLN